MPSSIIQPIFGKNPEFYAMSCTKCEWKETLELSNCEMEVITLDDAPPSGPRSVTELPKRCPECGARLTKKKLPFRVFN